MECSEKKCLCPATCELLGECVMGHPVVKDYSDGFRLLLLETVPEKRMKKVRLVLEALRPYKVSQYKMDRYWGLKTWEGIDLDKPNAPEKCLKKQLKHKDGAIKKKRKAVIEMLTKGVWEQSMLNKIEENYTRKKRTKKILPVKDQLSILRGYEPTNKKKKKVKGLGFYDNPINMEKALDNLMPSLPVKENIRVFDDEEHADFIRYQTPEQFQLARQHGWKIAKMLTEPGKNFHYD